MQRLEVSGAVRPIYGSLGVKRLILTNARSLPRVEWRILYAELMPYHVSQSRVTLDVAFS